MFIVLNFEIYISFFNVKLIYYYYFSIGYWIEFRQFDETSADFTLEKLMEMKFQNFGEQLSDVSIKSTVELGLENVLTFYDYYYYLQQPYKRTSSNRVLVNVSRKSKPSKERGPAYRCI